MWRSYRTKAIWTFWSRRAGSSRPGKMGQSRDGHAKLGGDRASDGNPKGIKDWSDLVKPGVGVLYPDPKTSGGARWNINAIYGSAYRLRGKPPEAKPISSRCKTFWPRSRPRINMDQSGRQSMANFAERGTGDAVVTYENELLLLKKEREEILMWFRRRRC